MTPRASVVLAVYNGASQLAETLESVLRQSAADFELIAVDDGSTDATPAILADYAARDPRLRVIAQANGGLTRALIRGCEAARAEIFVRQDCGDVSHPDRLRRMLALFEEDASLVVACSEVAFAGPGGEILHTTGHAAQDIRQILLHASIDTIVSLPAGAAAVMRASAYRQAGGYRPQFYFAQDLDLWIRLAGLGGVRIEPAALYEARVGISTISSLYRAEQIASASIAIALREATTEPERTALLGEVARIRPRSGSATAAEEAKAHYFIASCLRRQRDPRWRHYAVRAVSRHPLYLRPWLLLLRGLLG